MFIDYESLRVFAKSALLKCSVDPYSAEKVALGLCDASLRGVDSHGIGLLTHYVRSAQSGRKNGNPNFRFISSFPAVNVLDADDAFGLAAGAVAVERAALLAEEFGVGVVPVINSSHPGAMASILRPVAEQGFIGIGFTHADSLLQSHGGIRPFFGTNPICVAAPTEQGVYCLDMATSKISWNKLLGYKRNARKLPQDVASDQSGNMTTDANEARSLMPAGSYKGYGLASFVEILCGVYTGMPIGREIPSMYNSPMTEPRHLGQFYLALRTDGSISKSDFLARMTHLTDAIRNEPAQSGASVKMPGDPEAECLTERRDSGIPIDEEMFYEFKRLASELQILAPSPKDES